MSMYEFGVLFQAVDAPTLRRRARRAEALGFDLIGLGDSQLIFRDVYLSLGVVAEATERVRLGPTVTNPFTRHVAVTACAIATLDELSGGRAFLGIGTGDSSALSIGARAAPPERLAEMARTVRALVAGETADLGPVHGRLRWSARRVPIFFSADGPRALRAAGAAADGAILGAGISAEALAQGLRHLAEGARAAGRDPAELELWAFAKVSFGPTAEAAIEPLRATLAASAQRTLRRDPLGKGLPPDLLPALEHLIANYQVGRHGDTDAGGNARLMSDPRLARFMADRTALYGPPEQVRAQVRRIGAAGVRKFLLVCTGPDPDALLEDLGAEIVAPFKN